MWVTESGSTMTRSKEPASGARRVTMADVASLAGVSTTTVSFVLSGKQEVSISQETRDRVVGVAHELNYRRNAAAQSLASQRSKLLGVVTDVVTSPFAGEAILGVQDRAWANDLQVLIASTVQMSKLEDTSFRILTDRQVEAIAVIMTTHRGMVLPDEAREVPCVLVNSFDEAGEIPSIVPDEVAGGFDATHHILEAGHRRVAMINLESDRTAAVGRHEGHVQALRAADIKPDPCLYSEGPADAHHGYASMRDLLLLKEIPTAVFCATDRIAMGAYDAIKEAGLRIPEDISVVGFDDQQILTEYLRPALTTMRLPFREMAERAVNQLASVVSGDTTDIGSERIRCRLVERESVSVPPVLGRPTRG